MVTFCDRASLACIVPLSGMCISRLTLDSYLSLLRIAVQFNKRFNPNRLHNDFFLPESSGACSGIRAQQDQRSELFQCVEILQYAASFVTFQTHLSIENMFLTTYMPLIRPHVCCHRHNLHRTKR